MRKSSIKKSAPGFLVHTDVMSIDEAEETGAMALFGENTVKKVRVVSMGDFERILRRQRMLKTRMKSRFFWFMRFWRDGIASGVRRIEALTGAQCLFILPED